MKLLVRSWICLSLLFLAAVHCSSKASGFVVVVNSDVASGDIDEVRITVSREGQEEQVRTTANPTFPLTLGVTSEPGDRARVRATGLRAGKVVAENFANATVQDGDQRMLVLDLCRECQGLSCNGEFVCVTKTTCSAPGVDATSLPVWGGAPPAAACREADRPKRESSQTTTSPPVDSSTLDGGDGSASSAGDGGSEASSSCAACPARTKCVDGTRCQIIDPRPCIEAIPVKPGDVFFGVGGATDDCGERFMDNPALCGGFNWRILSFRSGVLPAEMQLKATVVNDGADTKTFGAKPFTSADCEANFGSGCETGSPVSVSVRSNETFGIGQRGGDCVPFTITFSLIPAP